MPELPEVETTKKSLNPLLGKTISNVRLYQPKLRWAIPSDIDSLKGYTLTEVKRRAKYLILSFEKSAIAKSTGVPTVVQKTNAQPKKAMIVHLGMSGSLQQHSGDAPKRKHDHLILEFTDFADGASAQLHYHDPRRFGAVLWYDEYADKLFNHLGPEPLDDAFSVDHLYQRIHRTKQDEAGIEVTKDKTPSNGKSLKNRKLKPITRPIKSVIMDQAFVVGVGNIYATESLFLAAIHPSTPAHLLSKEQLTKLVEHIKAILNRAIKLGGSTLRDFTVADGTTGYFQQTLLVYGKHKAPCPHCGTTIAKVIITGRASTYCPSCQPLDSTVSTK